MPDSLAASVPASLQKSALADCERKLPDLFAGLQPSGLHAVLWDRKTDGAR